MNQKGNVMLLSVLILAGVISAGAAVSVIIIEELRQSKNIDYSISAFYAAEAGIEDGLYQVRKNDLLPSNSSLTLSGGAKWERQTQSSEEQVYSSLSKDQSLILDLYNPDLLSSPANVESLKADWTDDCAGCSWLELSFVSWTPGAVVNWADNSYKFLYSGGNMVNNIFEGDRGYRVRLKALYGNISNLRVKVYSVDDAMDGYETNIPSRITINSKGSFSRSEQSLRASALRKSPMSGLFDYVLFSEESLVK